MEQANQVHDLSFTREKKQPRGMHELGSAER